MANRQTQDQSQTGNRNPGTLSTDDNEVQNVDYTPVSNRTQKDDPSNSNRNAQQNPAGEVKDQDEDEDGEIEEGSGGHV